MQASNYHFKKTEYVHALIKSSLSFGVCIDFEIGFGTGFGTGFDTYFGIGFSIGVQHVSVLAKIFISVYH
jgi:hypothetical protein